MDNPGRVVAIDYGARHIGVAISDEGRVIASPLKTVPNNGTRALVRALDEVEAAGRPFVLLVVGVPYRADGSPGPTGTKALALARSLRKHGRWEVVTVDESYTSKMADAAFMAGGGVKRKRRKQARNSVAASFILQRFLDHGAGACGGEGEQS